MNAYFAGGCFWCMEKTYHDLPGVREVVSGYCGGEEEAPAYEDVKAQKTGHRETVRVEYDERVLSFADLLSVYLSGIDPFDGGGQFIDRGHSYSCAVYYTDGEQKQVTEAALARLEREAGRPAAVSVEPFRRFFPAEEYHQHYAEKHPAAYAKEYEESGRRAFFEEKRQ